LGLLLEAPEPGEPQPVFYLWPECVGVWGAWCQLQTQWRSAGMGERSGLDYAAVCAWLQAHGYGKGRARNLRQALGDLQAMEREALNAWAQTEAKKAPANNG
jgi:hypothetical protein